MTGEEPKYKVFLLTQMYHVLFFYKPALQTTQSLDYIYSDNFLSCSTDTCSERHITPHLLLICLKGIFWQCCNTTGLIQQQSRQMVQVGLLLSNPCLEHNTQLPAK